MPTDVFGVLANPVRRKLLETLRDGPRSTGELAGLFALGRPAVSEHLAVLKSAGLVREEPRGRHRYYHLKPAPLAEVSEWLHPFEHYWKQRLDALADLLDEQRDQQREHEHDESAHDENAHDENAHDENEENET